MGEARNYINEFTPGAVHMKTYVCVRAYFNTEGLIIPETVIWEDGRKFNIDRVLDTRPAASLKGGGCGIRYTCRIGGKQTYIYLDGSRWFVDKKIN